LFLVISTVKIKPTTFHHICGTSGVRSFERNGVPRRINILCNFSQVSDDIVNLVLKLKDIFAILEVMRDTEFNLAKP
jgi:hypothetical protein